MDFIMPVWLKPKKLFWVIASFLVLSGIQSLRAAEININYAASHIINDIYVVNADLTYNLGKDTISALNSGIPLTFYIEIEFTRPKILWDKEIVRVSQRMKLEYHPLSNQYVLTNMITEDQQSFESLDDALTQLGKIKNLPVAEQKNVSVESDLTGKIRTGLDISSLPAPMRLQAWLSSEWRLTSGWYEWKIKP